MGDLLNSKIVAAFGNQILARRIYYTQNLTAGLPALTSHFRSNPLEALNVRGLVTVTTKSPPDTKGDLMSNYSSMKKFHTKKRGEVYGSANEIKRCFHRKFQHLTTQKPESHQQVTFYFSRFYVDSVVDAVTLNFFVKKMF